MRIGIDVGGTNTDAVLMDGLDVLGWRKTPTTPDVGTGIIRVLRDHFAVQHEVFPAQSGDRNTLRIGVVVIGAGTTK